MLQADKFVICLIVGLLALVSWAVAVPQGDFSKAENFVSF
jgi:hypothetical protein